MGKRGSKSVGKRGSITINTFGLNLDEIDIDHMNYPTKLYAFPLTKRVPDSYKGQVLRIYSEHTHPGYAVLVGEAIGRFLCNYVTFDPLKNPYTAVQGPVCRGR